MMRSIQGPEDRLLSRSAVESFHKVIDEIYDVSIEAGTTDLNHRNIVGAINESMGVLPAEIHHAVRPPSTLLGGAAILRSEALPLLPIDQIGPTPRNWEEAHRQALDLAYCQRYPGDHRSAIGMVVLARAAGEPFAWKEQQSGRMVNVVVPVEGQEWKDIGSNSRRFLTPHTEDAFHPDRANLCFIGCLCNPDVETTIAPIKWVNLSNKEIELLTQPTIHILPDLSYGEMGAKDYPLVPVSTFTLNDENEPEFVRFDPGYTLIKKDTPPEFQQAYRHLGAEFERVHLEVALSPGEILLFDNDELVHGRVPFVPLYNGKDRYLHRINVRLDEDVRRRPAAEADEHGYGQEVQWPFRDVV